jgi:putative two-component system response regulator
MDKKVIENFESTLNSNYTNLISIDMKRLTVNVLNYNSRNELEIISKIPLESYIATLQKTVHKDDFNAFITYLNFDRVRKEYINGNDETRFKFRRLDFKGEYSYYNQIIRYITVNGNEFMFLASEDIQDDLDRVEKENTVLKRQVNEIEESKKKKSIEITNPTLLIVDDSSIMRNAVKKIFVDQYNIITAKNGNEAIDLIKEHLLNKSNITIVGIFLDILMPVADGFVVLDFLKENDLFKKVPVSIISGDETKATRKRMYTYDIADLLIKPFNVDHIRKRMNNLINLYLDSRNMNVIINKQELVIKEKQDKVTEVKKDSKDLKNTNIIMNKIVDNICDTESSKDLKRIVRIIANEVKFIPEYKVDHDIVNKIVKYAPLYNVGAIAMKNETKVTYRTIFEEVEYGLTILETYIDDELKEDKKIARNIIKNAFELFNGKGLPNKLVGNKIPIEAQIVSLAVRLNSRRNGKEVLTDIDQIIKNESDKYNKDLLDIIDLKRKDIKDIKVK